MIELGAVSGWVMCWVLWGLAFGMEKGEEGGVWRLGWRKVRKKGFGEVGRGGIIEGCGREYLNV